MDVKNLKEELRLYTNWKVILNLTEDGTWEHTEYTVEEFLKGKEEIPFECYDVLYDWDELGNGDGHNVVCFYTKRPSLMESSVKFKKAYSR